MKEALKQLSSQYESERGQSREEYMRAFQKIKDENGQLRTDLKSRADELESLKT